MEYLIGFGLVVGVLCAASFGVGYVYQVRGVQFVVVSTMSFSGLYVLTSWETEPLWFIGLIPMAIGSFFMCLLALGGCALGLRVRRRSELDSDDRA